MAEEEMEIMRGYYERAEKKEGRNKRTWEGLVEMVCETKREDERVRGENGGLKAQLERCLKEKE